MTKNTLRAVAIGAAMLACGAMRGAADAPGAFGIGILRRDGIIVPFGAFDGKRWSNGWPAPNVDVTVPIRVSDVPSRWWGPTTVLERWQAWIAGEPQTLRVTQLDWVDAHCVRQVALRSDYRPPTAAPPRTEQPYPKDGLAVSPAQPVERIAALSPSSDDVRVLTPALLDAFNAAERVLADQHGHPVSRRAREGRVPDIEAIYAVGEHPRIYYVEASRRYRQLGQRADQCAALAFGTGWFSRDGDHVQALEMGVDLLGCDRAGASYMLPLGALRVAKRLFWVAQFSGWDHERYAVVEIKPKTVEAVLSVWGGSC